MDRDKRNTLPSPNMALLQRRKHERRHQTHRPCPFKPSIASHTFAYKALAIKDSEASAPKRGSSIHPAPRALRAPGSAGSRRPDRPTIRFLSARVFSLSPVRHFGGEGSVRAVRDRGGAPNTFHSDNEYCDYLWSQELLGFGGGAGAAGNRPDVGCRRRGLGVFVGRSRAAGYCCGLLCGVFRAHLVLFSKRATCGRYARG